jgi:hypothetical protein
MKIVTGSQLRTTTGLNMRDGPDGAIVATLVKDSLVEALGKPVDGWLRVVARGHTQDGKTLYTDPDVLATVKLTTRSAAPWQFVEMQGAVDVKHLAVEDGPTNST